jgi:cytochrome c oxidase cbb3-type subunit III
MTTDRTLLASVLFLLIAGTGCTVKTEEYVRPYQITDFKTLYSENCSGCHGDDGRLGAAQALNDPLFQHLAPKDFVRNTVAKGIPGHMMPGAAKSAGGFLTDKQIDILVDGMQQSWGHPGDFGNAPQLLAEGAAPGDAQRGADAYKTFCSSCHGPDGTGGKAGSIVDPQYLSMATNQYVRTTVIVGRPDLNIPDWRGYVPGHPMTAQEVSDVVAWIASHRPAPALISRDQPKESQ